MKTSIINFTICKYILSWCLFWCRPVDIHGTSRPIGEPGWLTWWYFLENRLSSGLAADGEESPTLITCSTRLVWRGHGAQRWHAELDRDALINWKHRDVAYGFFFWVDVPSRWPQFGISFCGFLKNIMVFKSIALNWLRLVNTNLEIVPYLQHMAWNQSVLIFITFLSSFLSFSWSPLTTKTAESRKVKELCTIVIHQIFRQWYQ